MLTCRATNEAKRSSQFRDIFVKESGNLTDREKYGAKLRNQTVQPLEIIESIF